MTRCPSPSRAILAIAALAALAALIHVAVNVGLTSSGRAAAAAVVLAAGALSLAALARFGGNDTRAVTVITLVSLILSLYLGELYFARLLPASVVRVLNPVPGDGAPDKRARIDVLRDLRDGGDRTAVPESYPSDFIFANGGLAMAGGLGIPLGGAALRTTLSCNESGYWPVYKSDEHGFANPEGLWGGPVEMAAVGDSFGHGNCVRWPDMLMTRIRGAYPRTINISYSGNGPLLELAGMKEYLSSVRPRVVLWLYYEGNDLENLQDEAANPILRRYLDEGAVQNLAARQPEIDAAIDAVIDQRIGNPKNETVKDFILMRNMRMALGLGLVTPDASATHRDADPASLRPVMVEAKRVADGWGGRIIFVYLPEFARFGQGAPSSASPHHDQVVAMVKGLGIEVVDLVPVFATQSDPVGLYSMRRINHYTPEGYRLVAGTIIDRLALGALPHAVSATSRQ